MRIRFYISLSLLVLLAFYGCGGGSSEVEMKLAQDAMDQARSLHADNLAPADFQQAQKAWDHGQAAQKEGNASTAKVLFNSAQIFAGKAADIAKAKQEALNRELNTMQLMISKNFDQVKSDLSTKNLSPRQQDQVKTIVSEVEKGGAAISNLVSQQDLPKAVAKAKDVQTMIYHAQLILAGQKAR
jgi:Tfp pilus assembly protein PilP